MVSANVILLRIVQFSGRFLIKRSTNAFSLTKMLMQLHWQGHMQKAQPYKAPKEETTRNKQQLEQTVETNGRMVNRRDGRMVILIPLQFRGGRSQT